MHEYECKYIYIYILFKGRASIELAMTRLGPHDNTYDRAHYYSSEPRNPSTIHFLATHRTTLLSHLPHALNNGPQRRFPCICRQLTAAARLQGPVSQGPCRAPTTGSNRCKARRGAQMQCRAAGTSDGRVCIGRGGEGLKEGPRYRVGGVVTHAARVIQVFSTLTHIYRTRESQFSGGTCNVKS